MPRIHEREQVVQAAEMDLLTAVVEWGKKHEEKLTQAEWLRVVNSVLSGQIASFAKYAIREERHGDADVPGGLERGGR